MLSNYLVEDKPLDINITYSLEKKRDVHLKNSTN